MLRAGLMPIIIGNLCLAFLFAWIAAFLEQKSPTYHDPVMHFIQEPIQESFSLDQVYQVPKTIQRQKCESKIFDS